MCFVPAGCNFLSPSLLGVCSDTQGSTSTQFSEMTSRETQPAPYLVHSSGFPSFPCGTAEQWCPPTPEATWHQCAELTPSHIDPHTGASCLKLDLATCSHFVGIPDLCCSFRRRRERNPRCLLWRLPSLVASPCALWTCEGGGRVGRGDCQLCCQGDLAPLTLQPWASDLTSSPAAKHLRPGPEGWGSGAQGQQGRAALPWGPPTGLSGQCVQGWTRLVHTGGSQELDNSCG